MRHRLVVCTTCRATGTDCRLGLRLLQSLERAADLGRPEDSIAALLEFAKAYRAREDGMTRFNERPQALRGKCLARIPSALMISETTDRELL